MVTFTPYSPLMKYPLGVIDVTNTPFVITTLWSGWWECVRMCGVGGGGSEDVRKGKVYIRYVPGDA